MRPCDLSLPTTPTMPMMIEPCRPQILELCLLVRLLFDRQGRYIIMLMAPRRTICSAVAATLSSTGQCHVCPASVAQGAAHYAVSTQASMLAMDAGMKSAPHCASIGPNVVANPVATAEERDRIDATLLRRLPGEPGFPYRPLLSQLCAALPRACGAFP